MHRFFLFSLTAASLLVAGSLFLSSSQGQDAGVSPEKEQPSIDRLASEMPRVQPKNPQESLRAMHVGRGFRVELVAAEPLVHDPVAVDFDEDGRMFVVQLPQYNGYAVEGFEAAGSISMLEDMDADGRFDKSTVYADDLNYPTAVACWDGGLFVGTAPDLLYIKDTDGDGVADLRQVVFTGFGSDKAGEAQLNSFRWGADNRFHISTNLAGGDVRATAEGAAAAVSAAAPSTAGSKTRRPSTRRAGSAAA